MRVHRRGVAVASGAPARVRRCHATDLASHNCGGQGADKAGKTPDGGSYKDAAENDAIKALLK